MNKSTHFSGQPTFGQIINLIPKDIVSNAVFEHCSDRYYKKFNTYLHLVTMLFSCYGNCSSLREVVTGMAAMEGRLFSSGVRKLPTRSTFSDANAKRNSEVFETIYFRLREYFQKSLPDSGKSSESVYLIDSTVITLFQEIFKGSGSIFADGRRKGGLKVHMAVPLDEQSPVVMNIGPGADSDLSFLKYLTLPQGSTAIFDRGYRSYPQFNLWTHMGVRWITRLREQSHYTIIEQRVINSKCKQAGLKKDIVVDLGFPQKKTEQVRARIIFYKDPISKKFLKFLTNDLESEPIKIAELYAKRWNIELLFKRLKQNMPLKYYLGDNQNAIKIQIWCALIADLLLQVIRKQVKKVWAFSTIVSLVRLHLFNYLNLFSFLENPEKSKIYSHPDDASQLDLDFSG